MVAGVSVTNANAEAGETAEKEWTQRHGGTDWLKESPESVYEVWAQERRALVESVGNLPTTDAENDKLESLAGRYAGQRAFVIGNGPSLNKTDLSQLAGEHTFAVNRFYLMYPKLSWRPTFFMCNDWEVMPDNFHEIAEQTSDSTLLLPTRFRGLFPKDENTVVVGTRSRTGPDDLFTHDITSGAVMGWTVLIPVIQIARYLGFDPIVLVGTDVSYTVDDTVVQSGRTFKNGTREFLESTEGDVNHFDPNYFGAGQRWQNPDPVAMREAFGAAGHAIRDVGGSLLNATVGGALDEVPRVDYSSLFEDPMPRSLQRYGARSRLRRQAAATYVSALSDKGPYSSHVRFLRDAGRTYRSPSPRSATWRPLKVEFFGHNHDLEAAARVVDARQSNDFAGSGEPDLSCLFLRSAMNQAERGELARSFLDAPPRSFRAAVILGEEDPSLLSELSSRCDHVLHVDSHALPPVDLGTFNKLGKAHLRVHHGSGIADAVAGAMQSRVNNASVVDTLSDMVRTIPNTLLYERSILHRNNSPRLHPDLTLRNLGRLGRDAESGILKAARFVLVPRPLSQSSFAECESIAAAIASGCVPIAAGESRTELGELDIAALDPAEAANLDPIRWEQISDRNAFLRYESGGFEAVFDRLLANLGLASAFPHAEATVTALIPTNRPNMVEFAVTQMAAQTWPHLNICVLANFDDNGSLDIDHLRTVANGRPISIQWFGPHATIGTMLNGGIATADTLYWAKIDDDDYYGPGYLRSAMAQRHVVDFDLHGLAASFLYSEATDQTLYRQEGMQHSAHSPVHGPSFIAKSGATPLFRSDARGVVDMLFTGDVAQAETVSIAGSPFEFLQIRRADKTLHTWGSADDLLHGVTRKTAGLRHGSVRLDG